MDSTELTKTSVLVSGVMLAINVAADSAKAVDEQAQKQPDDNSIQSDNCKVNSLNSVVVGLKGTSHFVRDVTCNMFKISNLPAGGHDLVLYSGDPKVVKTLKEVGLSLDSIVTITHVQLPKGDTLDQQWMTFEPPTLKTDK